VTVVVILSEISVKMLSYLMLLPAIFEFLFENLGPMSVRSEEAGAFKFKNVLDSARASQPSEYHWRHPSFQRSFALRLSREGDKIIYFYRLVVYFYSMKI